MAFKAYQTQYGVEVELQNKAFFKKSNNCKDHSPPVTVEFPISKPQQLSHKVHRGMEKPVEENQPDEMVGHLA